MKTVEALAPRRNTRTVRVGDKCIGSGHPVLVQSMTKTDTRDLEATLAQVEALAGSGCELVRVAVKDRAASRALAELVRRSPVPLAADIHFDFRLALAALDAGVAKLRINPGNIGKPDRVRLLAERAASLKVPIRVGVNSGSLEKRLLDSYGGPTAEALVESALGHCALLEETGFRDIVVSIKAPDVPTTVRANRMLAARCDYPIHLGITEAGTRWRGAVVSSVGLGILLAEGIGDTVRVSLTADPLVEVEAAFRILSSLGLRKRGPEIISCPTCGRTEVDLMALAEEVEKRLQGLDSEITVAVMGCEVNGPGEAREADFGIAAGKRSGVVFRKGQQVCSVPENELVDRLMQEIFKETGMGKRR